MFVKTGKGSARFPGSLDATNVRPASKHAHDRIKQVFHLDLGRMHLLSDPQLQALAEQVGDRLRGARQMLVTAESCTGGWIAKTVTDIAGSSDWFDCGLVAYSYEAKQALLSVNPHTLETQGAVSRETVIEMVSGALVHSGASVAVAVTGIAGPGGGTPDKPVGTVWIAWKRRGGYPRAELFAFQGDRDAVRRQTVASALIGLEQLAG
ncbi:MAG: CinA family protein [Xanthomonadaceae bacterium]|nr:CinA family protein [Xanthomonadaceae bacterium]